MSNKEVSAGHLEKLQNLMAAPPRPHDWGNPLEKIEELLTCPICLDRYKLPKLLPCQHSFCMEPCLDGLVDHVRRGVKCPECRAEHSLPYDGLKALPTNYTLTGFLEVHLQATDDNAEELEAYIRRYNLERCKVCEEKAEVEMCAHCEKKVCLECKSTHMDMVKRDLARLMTQIKRLSNRITEASDGLTKGMDSLTLNCESIKEEVKDYVRRYIKDLKKKEENLLSGIDTFHHHEHRLFKNLRQSLELESSNINEACARVEASLKGEREVNDEELAKFKQLFTEGLDYLRGFNPDSDDLCCKKLKFSPGDEPHILQQAITKFGELTVYSPQFGNRFQQLESYYVPRLLNLGLESDRDKKKRQVDMNDMSTWGSTSVNAGDSKRKGIRADHSPNNAAGSRRPGDEDGYSSRYRRRQHLEDEAWTRLGGRAGDRRSGTEEQIMRRSPMQTSRYGQLEVEADQTVSASQARNHLDTSPWNRVQQMSDTTAQVSPPAPSPNATPSDCNNNQSNTTGNKAQTKIVKKQLSTEDPALNERIENIRKAHELRQQNFIKTTIPEVKTTEPSADQPSTSPKPKKVSAVKEKAKAVENKAADEKPSGLKKPAIVVKKVAKVTVTAVPPKFGAVKKTIAAATESATTAATDTATAAATTKGSSASAKASASGSASDSPSTSTAQASSHEKEEDNSKMLEQIPIMHFPSSQRISEAAETPTGKPPIPDTPAAPIDWKKSNSKSTWQDQRSTSKDSEPDSTSDRRKWFKRSKTNPDLLGESLSGSNSHLDATEYRSNRYMESADDTSSRRYGLKSRDNSAERRADKYNRQDHAEEDSSTYGRKNSNSERRNRYKRKTEKSHSSYLPRPDITAVDTTSRSDLTRCEINLPAEKTGQTEGNRFYRVFTNPKFDYIGKGRMKMKFGCKGAIDGRFNWPRGIALVPSTEEIVVCDSSNHRLQIFDRQGRFQRSIGRYGSGKGEFDCLASVAVNKYNQFIASDRYNHRVQVFDSSGRFLREFGGHGQQNGRFNNPWGVACDNQGFLYVCDKDNHRVQIFQADGNYVGKFGTIGNRDGQFQNPHFITVNRQNQLIVTDSSNHRVQVFDHNGHFQFTFGGEGFSDGYFKYPRGVAVDDQGFIIVADSGNNRIQVFYPDGRFYATFGTWGSGDGQIKGVEGVTVTAEGDETHKNKQDMPLTPSEKRLRNRSLCTLYTPPSYPGFTATLGSITPCTGNRKFSEPGRMKRASTSSSNILEPPGLAQSYSETVFSRLQPESPSWKGNNGLKPYLNTPESPYRRYSSRSPVSPFARFNLLSPNDFDNVESNGVETTFGVNRSNSSNCSNGHCSPGTTLNSAYPIEEYDLTAITNPPYTATLPCSTTGDPQCLRDRRLAHSHHSRSQPATSSGYASHCSECSEPEEKANGHRDVTPIPLVVMRARPPSRTAKRRMIAKRRQSVPANLRDIYCEEVVKVLARDGICLPCGTVNSSNLTESCALHLIFVRPAVPSGRGSGSRVKFHKGHKGEYEPAKEDSKLELNTLEEHRKSRIYVMDELYCDKKLKLVENDQKPNPNRGRRRSIIDRIFRRNKKPESSPGPAEAGISHESNVIELSREYSQVQAQQNKHLHKMGTIAEIDHTDELNRMLETCEDPDQKKAIRSRIIELRHAEREAMDRRLSQLENSSQQRIKDKVAEGNRNRERTLATYDELQKTGKLNIQTYKGNEKPTKRSGKENSKPSGTKSGPSSPTGRADEARRTADKPVGGIASLSSTKTHVTSQMASPTNKFRLMDKAGTGSVSSPVISSTNKGTSKKDALVRWCAYKTKEYSNVNIVNMSSCWADGLAFCALIHHFIPDAFDYSKLDAKNRKYNLALAFKTAEDKADIMPLLEVEDMLEMGDKPDWKCVFTYVQSFYQRFKDED